MLDLIIFLCVVLDSLGIAVFIGYIFYITSYLTEDDESDSEMSDEYSGEDCI